jgi:hypothetical protein
MNLNERDKELRGKTEQSMGSLVVDERQGGSGSGWSPDGDCGRRPSASQ